MIRRVHLAPSISSPQSSWRWLSVFRLMRRTGRKNIARKSQASGRPHHPKAIREGRILRDGVFRFSNRPRRRRPRGGLGIETVAKGWADGRMDEGRIRRRELRLYRQETAEDEGRRRGRFGHLGSKLVPRAVPLGTPSAPDTRLPPRASHRAGP
jgi:hypothetical protein